MQRQVGGEGAQKMWASHQTPYHPVRGVCSDTILHGDGLAAPTPLGQLPPGRRSYAIDQRNVRRFAEIQEGTVCTDVFLQSQAGFRERGGEIHLKQESTYSCVFSLRRQQLSNPLEISRVPDAVFSVDSLTRNPGSPPGVYTNRMGTPNNT